MDLFNFFRQDIEKSISSRDVRGIIHALRDPDLIVQRKAAAALADMAPDEAVMPLVTSLTSPDRDVRRLSAMALGNIRDSNAVAALVTALKDTDPGVRLEVAEALGKIREPGAVDALLPCLEDSNADVRMMVIWGLGRMEDERAIPLLLPLLASPDHGIRLRAAEALEKLNGVPADPQDKALYYIAKNDWDELMQLRRAAIRPLLWALKDDYFQVREKAANTLGRLKDVRAVRSLIEVLSDSDGNVRMEAAGALGELGDKRALPALAAALKDDYVGVRITVAAALDRMKWSPATKTEQILYLIAKERWLDLAAVGQPAADLLTGQLDDPYYAIRDKVTKTLRNLGKIALPPMIKALASPDKDVRRRALWVIGKTGEPSAFDPLIRSLQDPDLRCREEAVIALGELADARAIPFLEHIIEEDESLGPAAVSALGMIHHPDSIIKLIPYISDEDPLIRINAVRALGKVGDTSILPHLAPALKDPDTEVRIAAIQAIVKFGGAETAELAHSALSDKEIRVRRIAVTKLIRMRNEHLPGILVGLLDDPDPDIRRIAALGLDKIGWHPSTVGEHRRYLVATDQWRDLEHLGLLKPQEGPGKKRVKGPQISLKGSPPAALPSDDTTCTAKKTEMNEPVSSPVCTPGTTPVEGIFRLISSLKNKNEQPSIRWKAAEGLGELGDVRGIEPLIDALKDTDAELRWRSALALGMIAHETAIDPLCASLNNDDQKQVRLRAAEALGKFHSAASISALTSALSDVHPDVRATATLSLGEIRTDRAVSAILTALLDPDATVRETAIGTLIKIGESAERSLSKWLRDRNPEVKKGALMVLSRMRPEVSSQILFSSLQDPDAEVRAMVASALEAIDWHPENDYQGAILLFAQKKWIELGKTGKTAVGVLTEGLTDRDPEVRRASADLLGTIGGKTAVSALMEGLHNEDREVRFASLRTLLKKPSGDGADLVSILKKE
jgi:HEAT repeat protein